MSVNATTGYDVEKKGKGDLESHDVQAQWEFHR